MDLTREPRLVAEIASVLADGPKSFRGILRALPRKHVDVLTALRKNPEIFKHTGTSKQDSQWHLVGEPPEVDLIIRRRLRGGRLVVAEDLQTITA